MKLINKVLTGVALTAMTATAAQASTLEDVRAADELRCIVSTGTIGFSAIDAAGRWEGFDVDFCRAVAAAVLGDGDKVKFVPASSAVRFTVLASGEADILFRNTTETMGRDAGLQMTFLPVNYYDGQGFLAPSALGVSSALELDGASVCIQTGTTTELNLADYFRTNGMSYEPVPVKDFDESLANYAAGRCDVLTTDASALASTKAALTDPSAHMVFPEIISKEPLGGAVRHGDDQWADIGKWVVNALINAEEMGITSKNAKNLAASYANADPSINRLLGTGDSTDFGAQIGLGKDWALNAILAVGNYGEIFERNVGVNTGLGLERGTNALWTDGGILYAAPIR
jgi:general L-amino acid transport system substrate-binding protein